jgi:acetylornithine deacetylase/succinyl-diaminopimelate desuccinylase-like protein
VRGDEQQPAEDGGAVRAAAREENARRSPSTMPLTYEISTIGDRPCGELPSDHPLVAAAVDATRAIGRSPELATASTDANVPISLGIPAVTLAGGGEGGNWHSLTEWYKPTDAHLGAQAVLLTLLTLVGVDGVSQPTLPARAPG